MNPAIPFSVHILRLNCRQPMAMVYGFVFPLLFLAAFAIIYRHDPRPVGAHIGELLTVTALGGACFGLPTALVSERERGIWKRYRIAGSSAASLMGGVILARLALLFAAGLMQIGLAAAFGMAPPAAPVALAIAFLVVCLTLICIGLVVAMLVDGVLAVQALGQCVFLPMLMLGGIAIRPETLPLNLQQVAAFLPGIHAVSVLQRAHDGAGLADIAAQIGVLALFAGAAALVAVALFRWDNRPRRAHRPLLAAGFAAWMAAGYSGVALPAPASGTGDTTRIAMPADYLAASPTAQSANTAATMGDSARPGGNGSSAGAGRADEPAFAPAPAGESASGAVLPPAVWQAVGDRDIARIAFERLPADSGLIAPLAPRGTLEDADTEAILWEVRSRLSEWAPGKAADPVQQVRNLLYIAAVPDVLQIDPLERHLPWLVFDHLRQTHAPADLRRLLFWISQHPLEGDATAITQLGELGLPNVGGADSQFRERSRIYALKLLRILERNRAAQ